MFICGFPSLRGAAGRQQRLIGRESLEMIAIGKQTDMTVGPDDQQRHLPDAQTLGRGRRKRRV